MKKHIVLLLAACAAPAFARAETVVYEIDPAHSNVTFEVRHFVNNVKGSFGEFAGTITVDTNDMSQSKTEATIQADSVNTNSAKRDGHLQKDDYFFVSKHPVLSFESTQWKPDGDDKFQVTGNLTMLGVTKPVTLEVEYLGKQMGIGPYAGLEIIGFEGETEIKRSDWGLTSGGPIVGDEVEIEISIQGHRKLTPPPHKPE